MPVALPDPVETDLDPPGPDEVQGIADGVIAAVSGPEGATPLQHLIIGAAFESLTGHAVETHGRGSTPEQLGQVLARRNAAFRTRILQTAILGALVLRPLPPSVADQVDEVARALSVDDTMLGVARSFAHGHLGLAAFDFERNGYTKDWSPESARALHASSELAGAWDQSVADPDLAARWAAFEHMAPGSLGRRMWEFYRARGFSFPGTPGSAPPLLAQHDFVHVLVGFGTTVESELEVFAFIARANDDPRGFSLLAMVVSLFETGYLAKGAGLFEASPGQLSQDGMAVRVADALRRGALSHGLDGAPDIDLMATDWFALAQRPVEELRDALGIVPASAAAVTAGSVGPWETGGISPFQHQAGAAAAAARGEDHETYGATP